MAITLGVLGLMWRLLSIVALLVILVELGKAQHALPNGELLRRLRAILASMVFVIMFPTVVVVDSYTDISPGFEWRPWLETTVWIAYATLATSLIRFWYALHHWVRKEW